MGINRKQLTAKRKAEFYAAIVEAANSEDPADLLNVIDLARTHGRALRGSLVRLIEGADYFPPEHVQARWREAERLRREKERQQLVKRDMERVAECGDMLPFLKPGEM